jgi:AcrR family transcriptional regulator
MSRAEGAERFLVAATTLGVAGGVSALTMQGIAAEVGVSKALVLYHFDDKQALLRALALRLAAADASALHAGSGASDPFEAWLTVGADAEGAGRRALLATLLLEPAVRGLAEEIRNARQHAATALGVAMLDAAGLRPRVSAALLGRVLLHQLDGIAAVVDARGEAASAARAALDAFALALLSLGEAADAEPTSR